MSKLVGNKRTKLIATHFKNLAVASVVTGIIVPAMEESAYLMDKNGCFLSFSGWCFKVLSWGCQLGMTCH
jgi:hypothetical protein